MRLSARSMLCLGVFAMLLTGCQHPVISSRDIRPIRDADGQARSLALTTPQVQASRVLPPGYEMWYDSRNDLVPSVVSGYESAAYEQSVTVIRDGQYTTNGRVRDHYRETTYRRTYRESTR